MRAVNTGEMHVAFPNKDQQWKPGESGNPAGKPKGARHISTWIQELMEDDEFEARILDAKQGYVDFKGAPIKAIIMTARHKAVAGDDKAREWLAKYGWRQQLDVTSDGEKLETLVIIRNDDPAK